MPHGVRFAPSPTGAFHLGNFRTAWISREWARALKLPWIVRFEDIDKPRVVAGAQQRQLDEMAQLGLIPDETHTQTEFHARHWSVFERAAGAGVVYPCYCSRKEVQDALASAASAPHGTPPVYSGHCRDLATTPKTTLPGIAWRFRAAAADGSGDFIVARTSPELTARRLPAPESFVPAYHWACAIDDLDGAYELLVRAQDLAPAADQQRQLQRAILELEKRTAPLPAIFHTALVVQEDGHRLEKRTRGVTLPELFERGYSPAKLLEAFKGGFRANPGEYVAEKIWGERETVLPISRVLGGA